MFEAARAGAAAYVRAGVEPAELAEVGRRVARGEYVINLMVVEVPGVAHRLLAEFRGLAGWPADPRASAFAPLSDREGQILASISEGRTNKEVAQALSISEQTVKNHMSSILRKLSLNDRTQAVVHAIRMGWISLTPNPPTDGSAARPGSQGQKAGTESTRIG